MIFEGLEALLPFAEVVAERPLVVRLLILPQLVVHSQDRSERSILPRLPLEVFVAVLRVHAVLVKTLGGESHLLSYFDVYDRSHCCLVRL